MGMLGWHPSYGRRSSWAQLRGRLWHTEAHGQYRLHTRLCSLRSKRGRGQMASKSDDTLGLALLFGVAYTALISIALLYGWHPAHDIHVTVRPRQHGNSDLG